MDYSNVGRIPEQAFIYSTAVLLAVCIVCACIRFYVRIRIQGQFSLDDGFLILGICCLISGLGVQYNNMKEMMLAEAFLYNVASVGSLQSDWLEQLYIYEKEVDVTLLLTWAAIVSVKMSFLFFFKKLIDRVQMMRIYWYFVTVFTLAVSAYGFAIYLLACPYFDDPRILQCGQGARASLASSFAVSQLVLDIVSDLMILAIPVRLLWKVRIQLVQKIAVGVSLCLTVIIITVTIIRASGLHHDASIDSVWEVYWQIVSSEVGLIMTSATAFRTFFIQRNSERDAHNTPPSSNKQRWGTKTRQILGLIVAPSRWRSKQSKPSQESVDSWDLENGQKIDNLPQIPSGTLSSIGSFIRGHGRSRASIFGLSRGGTSQIMQSAVIEEGEDEWPLSYEEQYHDFIKVQRDVQISRSEQRPK